MPKRMRLGQIARPAPELVSGRVEEPFALLTRPQAEALAQSMPDARSAILFALEWVATRKARMIKCAGPGCREARLSGVQLSAFTGRPIRTVRWSLARLKDMGLIVRKGGGVGRTSIYELRLGADSGKPQASHTQGSRSDNDPAEGALGDCPSGVSHGTT